MWAQEYEEVMADRRRLEAEGFANELPLMHKQVSRLEIRIYGSSLPLPPEPPLLTSSSESAVNSQVARSARELALVKKRMGALEQAAA